MVLDFGSKALNCIAIFAQFLFVGATFVQCYKVYKDGNSDGLSHGLIWMLILGFIIMLWYTIVRLNSDVVLLLGYIGQLVGFTWIAKYKYFPRIK